MLFHTGAPELVVQYGLSCCELGVYCTSRGRVSMIIHRKSRIKQRLKAIVPQHTPNDTFQYAKAPVDSLSKQQNRYLATSQCSCDVLLRGPSSFNRNR